MDSNIFCSSCFIPECNKSILIPYYLGDNWVTPIDRTCNTFREHTFYTKINMFKTTLECLEPMDKYICEVYVEPYEKSYTDICYNKEINIEKMQKESFCNSFYGCFEINNCYKDYIFCYDNESIPYLKLKNKTMNINNCKITEEKKYKRIEKEILLFFLIILIYIAINLLITF